jgi:integrase
MSSLEFKYSVTATRFESGEVVPVLVETESWTPARLALRWVMRNRRTQAASKTVENNLRSLRLLYEWAASRRFDLEARLFAGESLSADELNAFVEYLALSRSQGRNGAPKAEGSLRARSTSLDSDLTAIGDFLVWSMDPANRGWSPGTHPTEVLPARLREQRRALVDVFENHRSGVAPSPRLEPLSDEDVGRLRDLAGPNRKPDGSPQHPLCFSRSPWSGATGLRNWAMFALAEQLGLRIGEILKLTLDDVRRTRTRGELLVEVRRRPDDPHDTRRHPPNVKTCERALPQSPEVAVALRAYLTSRPPAGRAYGRTPYLFVTETGDPVSYDTARRAIQVLGRRAGIAKMTWHRLRHTWAESLARELLTSKGASTEPGQDAIEMLRYLGGGPTNSSTPHHHTDNAMREAANDFLRAGHQRLYTASASIPGAT